MKRKIEKTAVYMMILVWMLFIFYMSSMDYAESNGKSKAALNKMVTEAVEIKDKVRSSKEEQQTTNNTNINVENNTTQINSNSQKRQSKIKNFVQSINLYARKCVHAIEYFILSILLIIALNTSKVQGIKKYFIAILICFLYACTDEYHQTFIPGRNGNIVDVIIDTLGATLGAIAVILVNKYIINRIFKKQKSKKDCNKLLKEG